MTCGHPPLTDSATVLSPLAQARDSLAGFVVHADTTASASATQSVQLAASIRLLPPFLKQLKPLLADLGQLADLAATAVQGRTLCEVPEVLPRFGCEQRVGIPRNRRALSLNWN